MQAGRELDALVAEKVMGLEKRLIKAHSLPNSDVPNATFPRQDSWLFVSKGGFPEYFMGHCNDMYVDKSHGFDQTLREPPDYSTDIAAAWQVVEKITKMKRDGLGWFDLRFVNDKYEASFTTDAYYKACDHISAPSAPHAICLAALKAVNAAP